MSWFTNLVHAVGSALRPLEAPVGAVVVPIVEQSAVTSLETDLHSTLKGRGLDMEEAEFDTILNGFAANLVKHVTAAPAAPTEAAPATPENSAG